MFLDLANFTSNFFQLYEFFRRSVLHNFFILLFFIVSLFLSFYFLENTILFVIIKLIILGLFVFFIFFYTEVIKYFLRIKNLKKEFVFLQKNIPIYSLLYFVESDKEKIDEAIKNFLLKNNFLDKLDKLVYFYNSCLQEKYLFGTENNNIFIREYSVFFDSINNLRDKLND